MALSIDSTKKYDVFGIGSAMMDFLVEVEHDVLDEFRIRKGQFKQVNAEELSIIFNRLEMKKFQRVPGGSSANIITGIAQLGGDVIFCGKVGKGEHGRYYEEKLGETGVMPRLSRSDIATSKALTFITPDAQRSFVGFLGASIEMVEEDILDDDIRASKVVHIEGYHLLGDSVKTSMHVLGLARKYGIPVSLDLNDASYIKRDPDMVRDLIMESIDIVFANEEEAEALTGESDPRKAAEILSGMTSIAVVKNGKSGQFIADGSDIINVPGYPVEAVDTTGAGDMYAAGFLYGFTQGMPLGKAGRLGSFAASKIVEQIGARYEGDLKEAVMPHLE